MADPVVKQPDSTTTPWAPATIKDNPGLAKFKTQDELEKGYVELEKSFGARTGVPAADAKPEEWDAFYTKAGRPTTAGDYKLEIPKFENLEYKPPEEQVKGFQDAAHKAGLNPKQAQALMNWWGAEVTKQAGSVADLAKSDQAALQKEWGTSWDENLKGAQAGFKNFVTDGHKDLAALLKSTGMDSHPAVLKFFKALNDKLADGKVDNVTEEKVATEDEKTTIRADIAKLRSELAALPKIEREMKGLEYGLKLQKLYDKLYAGEA